jgi:hypothetical protein
MAGLVPAIHIFVAARLEVVDARDKRGHDEPASSAIDIRPRCGATGRRMVDQTLQRGRGIRHNSWRIAAPALAESSPTAA